MNSANMKLFIACLIIGVCCALPHNERIVGGQEVNASNVPYYTSIEYHQKHICGGSIISSNYVLTTASCVSGLDAFFLHVRAGSSKRETGGQRVFVKKVSQHPNYKPSNNDNDLAVLQLDFDFKFGPNVQPVVLPDGNEDFSGQVATVSGFGVLSENGDYSENLNALDLDVLSFEQCRKILGFQYNGHMVCAGIDGGKDACRGDVGSPLVAEGKLVGLVSWGIGCGIKGVPRVFTNIAALLDFVEGETTL